MSPESEPLLITDPALAPVLEELKSREPVFHHPDWAPPGPILTA
jgi:hypothetical protein